MTVDKIVEGARDFTSIAVSLTNSFQVPLQLWMRSAAALLRDKLSKVRAQVRDLSHLVVVVESINHYLLAKWLSRIGDNRFHASVHWTYR